MLSNSSRSTKIPSTVVLSPHGIRMNMMYFQYLSASKGRPQNSRINQLLFNGTEHDTEQLRAIANLYFLQLRQRNFTDNRVNFPQEPVKFVSLIIRGFPVKNYKTLKPRYDCLNNYLVFGNYIMVLDDAFTSKKTTELVISLASGVNPEQNLPFPKFTEEQMLSVMAFNQGWLDPILQKNQEKLYQFHKVNGETIRVEQIEMGKQMIIQTDQSIFIRLFYSNIKYSMLIAMPLNPNRLNHFISNLSAEKLDSILNSIDLNKTYQKYHKQRHLLSSLSSMFPENQNFTKLMESLHLLEHQKFFQEQINSWKHRYSKNQFTVSIPKFSIENNLDIGQLLEHGANSTFDRPIQDLVQMNRLYTTEKGTFNRPGQQHTPTKTLNSEYQEHSTVERVIIVDRPFVFFIVAQVDDYPVINRKESKYAYLYTGYVNDPNWV